MAKRGVIFKEAPVIAPNRSWCDDSAKHDTSCNFGELIVGHVSYHNAHDVIKLKSHSFGFMEAMLAPSFGKCDLFSYWFYVNNRHIWPDWKKFRPNNDQLKTWEQMRTFVSPTMPYITLNGLREKGKTQVADPFYIFHESNDFKIAQKDPSMALAVFKFGNMSGVDAYDNLGITLELVCSDVRFYYDGFTARSQIFIDSDDTYLIVAYKRNLQEIQSNLGNTWYTYDQVLTSMNIFSSGNLFNYMDLNIHDVQKDRFRYFDYVTRRMLYEYFIDHDLVPSYTNLVFDFSALENFMKRHFVNSVAILDLATSAAMQELLIIDDSSAKGYDYDNEAFSVYDDTHYTAKSFDTPQTFLTELSDEVSWVSKIFNRDLDTRINTLPIRAYEYIYDEYFRDQNWIPVNTYTDFTRNGQETYDDAEKVRYFSIRKKCWSHDPYTSSLPGPQRGDAVRFLSDASVVFKSSGSNKVYDSNGSLLPNQTGFTTDSSGRLTANPSGWHAHIDNHLDLFVDLSAATIEAFRIANARQRYEELFARTGGRYVEWQKGVMGANISDLEDERPIYIYGSRNPIQIAQVVQTSSTNVDTDQPLGDLAGRGVYTGKGDYIEFDCPDDGFLMQIICVVPQQSYQSGINPIFTRHNWLDFPIPMFAQLGEEHVKTQTLWFTGQRNEDEKSFGYQSRYWDFKYSRDHVSGQLSEDLDFWTFAREFEDEPVNGREFLEVNVDYRQFAVQDRGVHHVYLSLYCDIQKNHALPVFGIPTL